MKRIAYFHGFPKYFSFPWKNLGVPPDMMDLCPSVILNVLPLHKLNLSIAAIRKQRSVQPLTITALQSVLA